MRDLKRDSGVRPEEKSKIIPSSEIFGGEKLVLIRHGEMSYRLMITRQGKLILNK